jgi:tRNA A-37 threonylcarbamoyl transferase component Bud32
VLAARSPGKCGWPLHEAMRAAFDQARGGAAVFNGSRSDAERIGAVPDVEAGPPRVWIAAPVRDDYGTVIAVLDIGKPADERFSQLFEAARAGASGEAYAFDAAGRLLTASRFIAALEEAGRIKPGSSPIGALRLVDPGIESGEPPLTALIAHALAARAGGVKSGELLQPYRNYVGEPVIGAWRWFDDYDFGVAVEIAEREAFAPLARLETAFLVLGGLVSVAVFGLVVALLRMLRMQQEVEEAKRVGNYELLEEIGQGGFARVYRARHRLLKRPTAVKIVELRLANDETLARFDREARLASQLSHPNTVEVFDFGRTPEGQPFFAMEYLDGLTLQQVVQRHGALSAPRVAHALRGIAGSLAEAHARGLVHRDIKPANVMLCRRGGEYDVVKVLDFGLVKDTRTQATRDLTRALRVLGTPSYMAPERIEHPDSADLRSDLYALGAVGSFLLRGAPPFEGANDLALAYQVVHAPPPPLPATVPPDLARLIERCIAKSPAARPQSASEVIDALDPLLAQLPWTFHDAHAWWEAREGAAAGATAQPRDLPISAS